MQKNHQIYDLLDPIAQLLAVATAGLANAECSRLGQRTGQHNADPAARRRRHGNPRPSVDPQQTHNHFFSRRVLKQIRLHAAARMDPLDTRFRPPATKIG